jgi:hypothetical protein
MVSHCCVSPALASTRTPISVRGGCKQPGRGERFASREELQGLDRKQITCAGLCAVAPATLACTVSSGGNACPLSAGERTQAEEAAAGEAPKEEERKERKEERSSHKESKDRDRSRDRKDSDRDRDRSSRRYVLTRRH